MGCCKSRHKHACLPVMPIATADLQTRTDFPLPDEYDALLEFLNDEMSISPDSGMSTDAQMLRLCRDLNEASLGRRRCLDGAFNAVLFGMKTMAMCREIDSTCARTVPGDALASRGLQTLTLWPGSSHCSANASRGGLVFRGRGRKNDFSNPESHICVGGIWRSGVQVHIFTCFIFVSYS